MTETVVRAEKLCCQSGQHYLLKDIDWEVKKGEHWVVFGLNGSGKTTLLNTIAGFRRPTKGGLQVMGQSYRNDNLLALSKQVGWVSASFFDKYYTKETVLRIVLSGLFGTLGISSDITDADVQRARNLLEQWNVVHKIDMPFSMLSKGEQQNVLIARALLSDPQILVLDEPGTGLDVLARDQLLQQVKHLALTTDITMIYVTHYPEEIQSCFEHCLLLREGQVVVNGLVAEIFNSDMLSELLQCQIVVEKNANGVITLQRAGKAGETL